MAIKIENVVTPSAEQWEAIIRGTRNPMNSWDKSDSYYTYIEDAETLQKAPFEFFVGENDLELMKRLAKAGTDHRKFMRMITVYVDVTAPLYWWAEYDTYKVGTVRNSCSKMHTIHKKEFTLDDFSIDDFYFEDDKVGMCLSDMFINVVADCEFLRKRFVETNDKKYWRGLIQILPSSYNQKATLMLNYEVLTNIYHSRKAHKLDEWVEFCKWVETLPYAKELICNE